MYKRYPGAAIWHDAPDDPAPAPRSRRPSVRTLWAARSFRGRIGRCIAVRLVGDELLQVCVTKDGHRRWLPAREVLNERQAAAWRKGFRR